MLKLTDFCNLENQQKGLAVLRTVKNAIKRNAVLPTKKLAHSEAMEECTPNLTQIRPA